jgi:hypothetical protein
MAAQRVTANRREQLDLRRRLLELNEHSMRGRRVNEGDQRALGTRARLLVDQADAARAQVRQRRLDVVDPQCHMVQAGAPLVDELRDRRVGRRRLEHLERRRPGIQERRADPLRPNLLAGLDVEAEHVLEERKGSRQIAYRDPDVVQDGFHQFSGLVRMA